MLNDEQLLGIRPMQKLIFEADGYDAALVWVSKPATQNQPLIWNDEVKVSISEQAARQNQYQLVHRRYLHVFSDHLWLRLNPENRE